MSGQETSIKQKIQGLLPASDEVIQGTVMGVNPIKIQAEGDSKLIIGQGSAIIPQHLTDYTTTMDLSLDRSKANRIAISNSSANDLSTLDIASASVTIHNALKLGDRVDLLSLNQGKKYYVLGRTV